MKNTRVSNATAIADPKAEKNRSVLLTCDNYQSPAGCRFGDDCNKYHICPVCLRKGKPLSKCAHVEVKGGTNSCK